MKEFEFVETDKAFVQAVEVISVVTIGGNGEIEIACNPESKPWFLIHLNRQSKFPPFRKRILTDGDRWIPVVWSNDGWFATDKIYFELTTVDQRNIKRAITWWATTKV